MKLKTIFLGTGSAFTVGCGNFQSNVLIEYNNKRLLIDIGTDIRFSLHTLHYSHLDIDAVYVSHLHSDHAGGLEWLALTRYFDSYSLVKPQLFADEQIIKSLWTHSLSGGLSTLEDKQAILSTYFNVKKIKKQRFFIWQDIRFELIRMTHYFSNGQLMPCYGLLFNLNSTQVFYTADTQFCPNQLMPYYQKADLIFHDCETAVVKSGVHAHFNQLSALPLSVKQKMWLYHYNDRNLPNAEVNGFCGFVQPGQVFIV